MNPSIVTTSTVSRNCGSHSCSQVFNTSALRPGAHVDQTRWAGSIGQWGQIHQHGNHRGRLTGAAGVLPDMLIDPEYAYPGSGGSGRRRQGRGRAVTATRLASSQPTLRAFAVAAMLIPSMARRWRIQRLTRRVSFTPSSAHGREAWKILLPHVGLLQVKRGTRA